MLASTSRATSAAPLCSICSAASPKYTCPSCSLKTCSLACSRTHKEKNGCSGVRKANRYVGMDKYKDEDMWRDLAFLRGVGEKVKEGGKGIAPASLNGSAAQSRKGKERERDGGQRMENERVQQMQLGQRELRFKKMMAYKGVEVLFMPKEAERRKRNRSGWNQKKKKVILTLTVTLFDEAKNKLHSTTTDAHFVDTNLLTLLETSLSSIPELSSSTAPLESTHIILLPVPVRPILFTPRANNANTGAGPKADGVVSQKELEARLQVAVKEDEQRLEQEANRPLPKAHSSLPMRPDWVLQTQTEQQQQQAPAVVEAEKVPEQAAEDDSSSDSESDSDSSADSDSDDEESATKEVRARQVYLVSATREPATTLEQALQGTSVLEWPEFEIWPRETVEKEIAEGRMVYVERRKRGYEREHQQYDGKRKAADEAGDYGRDGESNGHERSPSLQQEDGDDNEDIDGERLE